MPAVRHVIADIDGTLVDSLPLIHRGQHAAVVEYLRALGAPPGRIPDLDAYRPLLEASVGGSARETLERAVRLLYAATPEYLAEIDFDALHLLLDPIQDRLAAGCVAALPGLTDFLATIGARQQDLILLTSGTPHHVVRNLGAALPELGAAALLARTDLDPAGRIRRLAAAMQNRFGIGRVAVVTCQDVTATKPDPEGVGVALGLVGGEVAACAYVGDHASDLQAAAAAGVPVRIGVGTGFGTPAQLWQAGASAVVDGLAQVSALLAL